MNKMTKIFMTAVLAVVMFACGNGEQAAENQADTTAVDTVSAETETPVTVDTAAVTTDTATVKADSAK